VYSNGRRLSFGVTNIKNFENDKTDSIYRTAKGNSEHPRKEIENGACVNSRAVFRELRKKEIKQQDPLQSSHKNFSTMSEPSNTVVNNGVYDRVLDPFFDKGMSDYERLKTIMTAQGSKMMQLDRGIFRAISGK
jgi:hypothetical protein